MANGKRTSPPSEPVNPRGEPYRNPIVDIATGQGFAAGQQMVPSGEEDVAGEGGEAIWGEPSPGQVTKPIRQRAAAAGMVEEEGIRDPPAWFPLPFDDATDDDRTTAWRMLSTDDKQVYWNNPPLEYNERVERGVAGPEPRTELGPETEPPPVQERREAQSTPTAAGPRAPLPRHPTDPLKQPGHPEIRQKGPPGPPPKGGKPPEVRGPTEEKK